MIVKLFQLCYQDPVICLDEDMMTTPKMEQKSKPQKCLRSLNDVLGKASSVSKDAKPATGIMSQFTSYQSFQSPSY